MQAYHDGRSETALGEALRAAGAAAATAEIGTKILPTNCKNVREHVDASLKRLGVDCIYLYQVHSVPVSAPHPRSLQYEKHETCELS